MADETENVAGATNAELIASIDSALGIESASSEGQQTEGEQTQGEQTEGEQTEGEQTEGEQTEGEQTEGEQTQGEQTEGEHPQDEAAKAAAEAAAKAKPDFLNDPVPKELAQETQQRMRYLIKTAKEQTSRAEQIENNFKTMVSAVESTGTNPDQYRETLSWLAMFNSGDPQQQRQALQLVEGVADRLATLLGVTRTPNDPLSGHADLQQAVQQGQITQQYAQQLAVARNSQRLQGELRGQAAQTFTQQQSHQQALTQARTDLNTLEDKLRASDPRFEEKKALLLPILKEQFQDIHPSKWAQAFERAYSKVKLAPAQRAAPKAGVPAHQPLRAGAPAAASGGVKKAPKDGLEAMDAALAELNG